MWRERVTPRLVQGAVYTNRMINVGVLNNKLFFRSVALISMFSGASEAAATDCLLRAIHEVEELTPAIRALEVSAHIRVCARRGAAWSARRNGGLRECLVRAHAWHSAFPSGGLRICIC